MKNFFFKIGAFFRQIKWGGFLLRLKPRLQLRWFLTFFFWLAVLVYVVGGIVEADLFYKKQATTPFAEKLARVYPVPAVVVNGNIIWAKDYYARYNYIANYYAKTNANFDAKDIKGKIIDLLIEKRVIEWEASKHGIRVSNKDVEDVYNKIVQEKGEVELQKVLHEMYGMNGAQFKDLLRTEIYTEKVQNELIAQVKLQHILVKNEAKANEVANKAKSGEAFENLAKTYSEDVKTRDSAGDLGWIARGTLFVDNKAEPEFEEAAFAAKVGEIFGPVKTNAGFEIGRVQEKKGSVEKSYTTWLEDIKKSAKVIRIFK